MFITDIKVQSNFEQLRRKHRLTVTKLAMKSGVSSSTISRWLNGNGEMLDKSLFKLVLAFESLGEDLSYNFSECTTFKSLRHATLRSQSQLSEEIGWTRNNWQQFEDREGDITSCNKSTIAKLQEGFRKVLKQPVVFYPPSKTGEQFSFYPPDFKTLEVTTISTFKELRAILGNITQIELAKKLGCSEAVIYGAETNKTKPNEETLWALEDFVKDTFSKKTTISNSLNHKGSFVIDIEGEVKETRVRPFEGLVYFVQEYENGPIKIGFTTDLPKRLNAFATASPTNLRVIGCIAGDMDLERELHKKFDLHRIRDNREWFNPHPTIFKWLSKKIAS
jgi:transcriptional regulator with XRE-family HTH domain